MSVKQVDGFALALMILGVDIGGLEAALEELWEKIPEKEGGPSVKKEDFMFLGRTLWFNAKREIYSLTGVLPEVTEEDLNPPEPTPTPEPEPDDSNKIRIMNTGAKMSWNSYMYDKFVFPKLGPEYTSQPFDLVFSDGNKLFVSDPEHMVMTPDNMKYQPGGQYSGNNPDIPTMEVYARRDTHPEWVVAVFRHSVDNTVPDTPEPTPSEPNDGWETIEWGGNPSLDWHSNDSRSRLWWTEIHGSSGGSRDWSRKFPLPKSVENARSLDFKFSDGTSLHVSNPKGMAMLPNGPKYRPQDGNNEPNKNHPKVGAVPGSPVTWVKYRVNR